MSQQPAGALTDAWLHAGPDKTDMGPTDKQLAWQSSATRGGPVLAGEVVLASKCPRRLCNCRQQSQSRSHGNCHIRTNKHTNTKPRTEAHTNAATSAAASAASTQHTHAADQRTDASTATEATCTARASAQEQVAVAGKAAAGTAAAQPCTQTHTTSRDVPPLAVPLAASWGWTAKNPHRP